jgi:hypothetical protein
VRRIEKRKEEGYRSRVIATRQTERGNLGAARPRKKSVFKPSANIYKVSVSSSKLTESLQ